MAVINLNIGEVVEDCPNITIPDISDYSVANVFVYSDFKFHNYILGTPDVNTEFTFDTFVFGPFSFTGVSIVIETDGAGNIINPETQYLALRDELNAASSAQISIELVKPADTGYRDWFLRISSDTQDNYAGESVSVNATGGSITPLFTQISGSTVTGGTPVSVRNLTLLDKDGTPVELGAVKQVDQLTLEGDYTPGETFSLDFCSDIVSYMVTSENSAECVAQGILDAIAVKTGGLFERYVEVEREGSILTFTSKEAGVPLQIEVTYTGNESFVYNTITANVPSMALPSFTNSDEVVYETQERGGQYTAILTVVSDCDYNVATREFFSWCFDLSQFDCCFVSIVKNGGCCCKGKERHKEACALRNVIDTIPIMIDKGFSESDIQKVVDLGWSICQSLECGCKNC